MTQPRYLLDTDILVAIRRGRPAEARSHFQRLRPGEAVLSVITYGELLYGIEKKQLGLEPLRQLEELVSLVPVLPLSPDVAHTYGVIRAALAIRGEIIGANDLWIAAQAKASDLTLVSNNEREFRRGAGLKLENWMG